jgi:hypothetical protein
MVKRSLRNGLLGAVLFVLAGMVQACSADATGPVANNGLKPQADLTCYWMNGQIVCE